MTTPATTHVIGPAVADGSGELGSIKRAAIVSMEIGTWAVPVYDPDDPTHHIDWGPTNYAVLVVANNHARVRVQTYPDRQDAVDYVTDDPDGYLQ